MAIGYYFTMTPNPVNVGTSVTFVATTTIGQSPLNGATWNFGDGNTGSGLNVTHTYATAGFYNVTCVESRVAGGTINLGPTSLEVDAPAYASNFYTERTNYYVGCVINCTSTSAPTPDSTQWLVNGVAIPGATGLTFAYHAAVTGTPVVITQRNTWGTTTLTSSQNVNIYPRPVLGYTLDPTSGATPLTVNVTDTTTPDTGGGAPTGWRYDMSPTAIDAITTQNGTYTYPDGSSGTYTVYQYVTFPYELPTDMWVSSSDHFTALFVPASGAGGVTITTPTPNTDTTNGPSIIDIPMEKLTDDQYGAIGLKNTTSILPMKWYDNGNYPLRTVSVWPIPTQVQGAKLWLWQPLIDAVDLDTDIVFPKGYERALRFALAVELAAEFGKEVPPGVKAIARQSKAVVKRLNATQQIMVGDIAISSDKSSMFNYITGDTIPNNM